MKGLGYVGFGEVESNAVPIREFTPSGHGQPLLERDLEAPNPSDNVDDIELCEWVVPVRWIKTFPRDQAQTFKGVFANQNIVCKLRDASTVGFLEEKFGIGT